MCTRKIIHLRLFTICVFNILFANKSFEETYLISMFSFLKEVVFMELILSSDAFYSDSPIKELVDYIRDYDEKLGKSIIFYQYPIYVDIEDKTLSPKLMIVSQNCGVIIVNCDTSNDLDKIAELDEDTSSIEDYIFSKLIKSQVKEMKSSRRELSFTLKSVLYLPVVQRKSISKDDFNCELFFSKDEIETILSNEDSNKLTELMIKEICAILEGSKVILKPKNRQISKDDESSKGFILKQMEEQIAYFDSDQKKAALAQLNGPQRIRGLAGSGKTIILCMKAALIHLRNPEKKILYTFMTRSLYDYIETMIIRFYRIFGDGNLPDFDKIQIEHSWGGRNINGVYYSVCQNNGIVPITFKEAKMFSNDPFDFVCEDLLDRTQGNLKQEYDYVLMDEAQDFKPSFYQLCRAIVKNDCLVWCYDDLQNIFDVKIQDTIATFKNKYGWEGIDLVKLNEQFKDLNNDVVLDKTYRNPKEILVMAHAIGFGIYNDVLIQTLENNQHWKDFGYNVISGNCNIGDEMIIERPSENSPLIISKYQKPEQIIEVQSLESREEEILWIADSIENNIKTEFVRADDIIVISLDDKNSKKDLATLSYVLNSREIMTFNITDNFYSKGFISEDCVTLSTVYKAKGNEAAIVYVMGTDVFEYNKNRRNMRNKVFTAFTRAKGWLKISGVDIKDSQLWNEIQCVFDNKFILKFIQTETKYKIERDKKEKQNKIRAKQNLNELKAMGYSKSDIDIMFDEMENVIDE